MPDATDGLIGDHYGPLKDDGILSALVLSELGGGAIHEEMGDFIRDLVCATPARR